LHFLYCLCRRVRVFKNYEGLPFRLEVFLGNDFQNGSIFAEYFIQGFLQLLDLNALFEIANLYPRTKSEFEAW
jgi:hypothetical protein